MKRKTKIVATYGPALREEAALRRVLQAGADVIRLNFSYADHADHARAIAAIRRSAARLGRPIAILQDLGGPKIRLGRLERDPLELERGMAVVLEAGRRSEAPRRGAASPTARMAPAAHVIGAPGPTVPIEGYPTLTADVKPGERVLLGDGAAMLRVLKVLGSTLRCKVEEGGAARSRQGVHFPDTALPGLPAITAKDRKDLAFGLDHGVDWIALSFVRSEQDILRLRGMIARRGTIVPVIAKIEKREALDRLDRIVDAADGVMVARGDLGVETDLAEVALRQKEIIASCNRKGKIVITATQMLESMIESPRPTRAEVSDVSNAILDGTDAVMLSGETAVGRYGIEAVRFMDEIARRTEAAIFRGREIVARPYLEEIPDAVAHAACVTAQEIRAAALICHTRSGLTARLVSRYRPSCPIVAVSPEAATLRRLAIVWGVIPLALAHARRDDGAEADGPAAGGAAAGKLAADDLAAAAIRAARRSGLLRKGDPVVITAGASRGALRGRTNLVRVEIG